MVHIIVDALAVCLLLISIAQCRGRRRVNGASFACATCLILLGSANLGLRFAGFVSLGAMVLMVFAAFCQDGPIRFWK